MPIPLALGGGPNCALKLKPQKLILLQDWEFLSCRHPLFAYPSNDKSNIFQALFGPPHRAGGQERSGWSHLFAPAQRIEIGPGPGCSPTSVKKGPGRRAQARVYPPLRCRSFVAPGPSPRSLLTCTPWYLDLHPLNLVDLPLDRGSWFGTAAHQSVWDGQAFQHSGVGRTSLRTLCPANPAPEANASAQEELEQAAARWRWPGSRTASAGRAPCLRATAFTRWRGSGRLASQIGCPLFRTKPQTQLPKPQSFIPNPSLNPLRGRG